VYRPLVVATATWTAAVLAALAGVLLPIQDERLSFALFAFAVGLGLLVAALMIADGVRRRRSRRHTPLAPAQAVLDRLEYLPSITTGTWRIQWHGARTRVMAERPTPGGGVPAELLGRAPDQLAPAKPPERAASAG